MPVFVDTETHLIQPGRQAPPIVCTAVCVQGEAELFRGSRALAEVLASGAELGGVNIAYDMACLLEGRPDLAGAIFQAYADNRITDVSIRQQLADIAMGLGTKRPYGLAALARRAFGEHVEKENTWRLRYSELDGVPIDQYPPEAYQYPLGDVRIPERIYEAQEERSEWFADQYRQAAAAFALKLTAGNGLIPDPVKVRAWEADLRARYNERKRTLESAGLVRKDGTRDTKAATRLIEAQAEIEGFELIQTDGGGTSISAEACARSTHPVLVAFGEIGGLSALLNKDLKILQCAIVHTRFDLAESGRSTSSGPNVQNLNRVGGVRECFSPPPGRVFVSADFSTLELCSLAQVKLDLFGACPMADAINAGRDLHVDFGGSLIGLNYETALARYLAGDPQMAEMRQLAKAANFGFPGGLSAGAFVGYAKGRGVVIDLLQARALRDAWMIRWGIAPYFAYVNQRVKSGQGIWDPRAQRLRGGVGFCDGCNTGFQGLAANAAKGALFEVARGCYVPGYAPGLFGARPVNFVHDEIVLTATFENAHNAALALESTMVKSARVWHPDVLIKAEPLVSMSLSKRAKPKKDAEGRFTPWNG